MNMMKKNYSVSLKMKNSEYHVSAYKELHFSDFFKLFIYITLKSIS